MRRNTTLLNAALLLLVLSTNCIASANHDSSAVAVVESLNDDDDHEATATCTAELPGSCSAEATTKVVYEDFEATDEWQEIKPNQAIPPGLHVRMNLETGLKEAKILKDKTGIESESTIAMKAEAASTKKDESSSTPSNNKDVENLMHSLEQLPVPPSINEMTLHDAYDKLSPEEFRKQVIKLWNERQATLLNAMDAMENAGQMLQNLIEEFISADVSPSRQLAILEELESEVTDLDKARDFNTLGGIAVMIRTLNSTNVSLRTNAAWVLGSAVKNFDEAQEWALNQGALPKLCALLIESPPVSSSTTEDKVILDQQRKGLYALGSLMRNNERAQRAFLVHNGVDSILYPYSRRNVHHKLVIKIMTLLHDLLNESSSQRVEDSPLKELQATLKTPAWCETSLDLLAYHTNIETRRKVLETIILLAQRSHCSFVKDVFKSVRNELSTNEDDNDDLIQALDELISS